MTDTTIEVSNNCEFDYLKFINEDFIFENVTFINDDAENLFNSLNCSTPNQNQNDVLEANTQNQVIIGDNDLIEFDPNLIELEELLSTSRHSDDNSNLIEKTLNNVHLVEEVSEINQTDFLSSNFMIIKAPENLENNEILESLPSLNLKPSTLKAISKATMNGEGVFLPSINMKEYCKPVRRSPLKMIQQIINCVPISKNNNQTMNNIKDENNKKIHKRKQSFEFSREDGIVFLSDTELSPSKETPSPKKSRVSNSVYITPELETEKFGSIFETTQKSNDSILNNTKKIKKYSVASPKKCPGCSKEFKRLVMHKCRISKTTTEHFIKIKPSEIKINSKCKICGAYFNSYEKLDDHQKAEHSQLICKTCKYVAKSLRSLNSHSYSCGKKITSIFKVKKKRFVKIEADNKKQK